MKFIRNKIAFVLGTLISYQSIAEAISLPDTSKRKEIIKNFFIKNDLSLDTKLIDTLAKNTENFDSDDINMVLSSNYLPQQNTSCSKFELFSKSKKIYEEICELCGKSGIAATGIISCITLYHLIKNRSSEQNSQQNEIEKEEDKDVKTEKQFVYENRWQEMIAKDMINKINSKSKAACSK